MAFVQSIQQSHPTRLLASWWRHQMETFSALLAICAGNSPVPGEFSTQRPVTRSCDVFFDLCLNKWLSKQSWGWWFETLLRPLWRQCNVSLQCKSGSCRNRVGLSFCLSFPSSVILSVHSETCLSTRSKNIFGNLFKFDRDQYLNVHIDGLVQHLVIFQVDFFSNVLNDHHQLWWGSLHHHLSPPPKKQKKTTKNYSSMNCL